jgi:hypothetical protein
LCCDDRTNPGLVEQVGNERADVLDDLAFERVGLRPS